MYAQVYEQKGRNEVRSFMQETNESVHIYFFCLFLLTGEMIEF